jgi:hypothetical protein
LEDYHLACRAGWADDDLFIIQFLPIYLADTARAWLDHLPRNMINSWEDLMEIFTGNFEGTYMRPDHPYDQKGCRQKRGDSLQDYIQWFSRKCHELPKICDADVISPFWSDTSYRTLVHELGRDHPKTTKELFDITTQHASGEEAIRAVFIQGNGKAVPVDSQGSPRKTASKGAKRSTKGSKRGPKWRPQWIAVTTSYDEGDNNKEADDSDEEHVTATKHDFKRQARQPTNHFEKFLKATYPNHA